MYSYIYKLTENPAMEKSGPNTQLNKPVGASPATLTLQWLAYAFWGWLGLVLIWLTATTFNFFIRGNQSSGSSGVAEAIVYPLAAVVVLAVIAGICDWIYARRESTPKKVGGESVIMIIHTVIFALLGIGAVIVAVFALISMLMTTSSSDGDYAKISLFTALVVAVFYAGAAMRTALAGHIKHMKAIGWSIMLVVVGGVLIASIAGPTAFSISTKQDRLIEKGIGPLAETINSYANQNNRLPDSLESLNLTHEDAKQIVNEKLVTYKPDVKPAESTTSNFVMPASETNPDLVLENILEPQDSVSGKIFYYELCVNYKAEKKSAWESTTNQEYRSYVSGYDSHGAGDYCYKASTFGKY